MESFISTVITIFVLSYFLMKVEEAQKKKVNFNEGVVLQFPKPLLTFLKGCGILFIGGAVFILIYLISEYDSNLLGVSLFLLGFSLIIFIIYVLCSKKIIFVDNQFTVQRLFKKNVTYHITEINKIKDKKNNALVFYSNNKKVFTVDYQLESFNDLYDYLKNSNIPFE